MLHHSPLFFRDHTAVLEIRDAVPRPQSFDAATRTVEAVIASASPVQRTDARGAFLEILDPAGLDLVASRGASVLDSHQRHALDNVLGTLDSVRVEGSEVIGVIRFSSRPEIAPLIADVRDGVIQHLSIGYQVGSWRDGSDAAGNRTRTATQWVIREASFVSVPADRNAHTRNLPGPSGDGQRAEINRQIRGLAQRAGIDDVVTNSLIDRNASLADARAEILFELQIRSATANVRTAGDMSVSPEMRVRAIGEALFCRATPGRTPSNTARPYDGMSIATVAGDCLSRAGISLAGLTSASLIERALHSTSDFPLILADSVNRTLRAAYDAATSAIRRLARETSAADFRTKHRLMLDSSGLTLEKVNEAGEFKSGTMEEAEETYALDSFGRIFSITRKALVNDDVNAFGDISRRLGQAAANFEAQALVNLLVSNAGLGPTMKDTKTLFHADHKNVSTSGAAPSETTLDAARLAMRRQTGPSGGLIIVEPVYLVVPPEMETATQKTLTAIQPVEIDNVNAFSFLRMIVEPRLVDADRWYLVADPAAIDGLEFAYLQ
jgi:phage head maturation protease